MQIHTFFHLAFVVSSVPEGPTSVKGLGRRSSANWWWQSSQWLLLEAVSQCSRQARCTMARLPEHSQGDSSSPEALPSWQILQNSSSLHRHTQDESRVIYIPACEDVCCKYWSYWCCDDSVRVWELLYYLSVIGAHSSHGVSVSQCVTPCLQQSSSSSSLCSRINLTSPTGLNTHGPRGSSAIMSNVWGAIHSCLEHHVVNWETDR